jgi:hypothetical protein
MTTFEPSETRPRAVPDTDPERQDAPLPTRFGRDWRRRPPRPRPSAALRPAAGEPPTAADSRHPFDDDGGL